MTAEPVQFSVATSLLLHRDFRPIEEVYRVHKGEGIVIGAIEFTLDGKKYLGELYNTEIIYLWEGIIEMCRKLLETGEPASTGFDWGGSLEIRYAGWEQEYVEMLVMGKHAFYVPRGQFMRVTLEGALHTLRLMAEHFPRVTEQAERGIRAGEETLKLVKE